jgi:dTDP-glucose 4,6-dehydratase
MAAGRTYNFPYLITRTCNNYGENQHQEKFIPTIINSIKNNQTIPVYGDGKQVREWIHADDNAAAIYKLLMSNKVKEIYNIGSGESYQNIEILKLIGDHLKKDLNFKYVDDRLGHDRRYALNCSKYLYDFGNIKNISFQTWLTNYIDNL